MVVTILSTNPLFNLDNPVACLDYSSLYPSSMISENLSQDSKVWTKEYNLNGKIDNLLKLATQSSKTNELQNTNLMNLLNSIETSALFDRLLEHNNIIYF